MKVAYVQFEPAFNDREATVSRLEPLLKKAAGADLVVLPELANSGYNFAEDGEAGELAETPEGPFCTFLHRWCRETDTVVVAGLNELDGTKRYNSSVIINSQGHLGTYRKLHLFNREKRYFTPGDLGVPVFDIGEARVAMLVCFDWTFPEVWRIAALNGADIVCHPSNLVLPGLAQRGVPVHSLVNRIFCITANRTGTERDLTFTGRSIITDTRGTVIAEAPEDSPAVAIVEIDPREARDKQITEHNHLLNDRRPEMYGAISGIVGQKRP